MSRIDIQLLQIVLDDIEAALPALSEHPTEATVTPICRLAHARSLLAGLLDLAKKETA